MMQSLDLRFSLKEKAVDSLLHYLLYARIRLIITLRWAWQRGVRLCINLDCGAL